MMPTIDARWVTFVNTFRVLPEKQTALVEAIVENTKELSTRAGFIGAAVHRSANGTRVLNYVQWRSREEFEAMRADPVAMQRMRAAGALAEGAEPEFYDVAFATTAG